MAIQYECTLREWTWASRRGGVTDFPWAEIERELTALKQAGWEVASTGLGSSKRQSAGVLLNPLVDSYVLRVTYALKRPLTATKR